ncbi:hypothetical protein N0V88_003865 [Collariella sp. IMI 366227]|nr:hypothetical protein N0V88_003865 [Collariella sp. IMI 366227]
MTSGDSMLNIVGTGTALIGLCSVPAVGSITTKLSRRRDVKQDGYEDADGKATPESVKAYSAKLPKSVVLASAGAGLCVSIALLVISPHENGRLMIDSLTTGAWALLLLQATTIASSRSTVQSYNLGFYTFLSATLFACLLLSQGTKTASHLLHTHPSPSPCDSPN